MRVKVLGSAAGGGFPQWNCACRNCSRLRQGTLPGTARTQSQLAISADGDTWFLLNASPDLRSQLERTPELHPRHAPRHTPISGVVLTSGDLDHVLGLLLLREFQPMRVYGTPSLRAVLMEDNSIFRMLFSGPRALLWTDIVPNQQIELEDVRGRAAGISINTLALGGNYPRYTVPTRMAELAADEAILGLSLCQANSPHGSGRLIYAPGLARVDDDVRAAFASADLLLVDGTFWSEEELCSTIGRSASDMGHLPISGSHGTLQSLAGVRRPRKVFIHINNTNPILDEDSPEYQRVRAAGWEVAEDGVEFNL